MLDYEVLADCSGCHSCFNVCPAQCITMEEDVAGFLYPKFDKYNCINCGLCENVCPILNNKNQNSEIGKAYACYNKDEGIRMHSSSGGMFTLIAENIIEKGGVVFGAAFDDKFDVRHICVETKEELSLLRGSKYVQSTIGDSYVKAREILDNGRFVLFTGAPCQIDGLLNYLGKRYDKLFTQDIICHGVPAPAIWRKYIKFREKKAKSVVSEINFRNKDFGWYSYCLNIKFLNCAEYKCNILKESYMKVFLSNFCLRQSCYNCHSKTLNRRSDITLADFWGVDKIVSELFDNKGTSLIFINSEKGQSLLEEIKENIIYTTVSVDDAVKYNSSAYKSVEMPINRENFINDILIDENFDRIVMKYTKQTLPIRIARNLKYVLKKIIKQIIRYLGEII